MPQYGYHCPSHGSASREFVPLRVEWSNGKNAIGCNSDNAPCLLSIVYYTTLIFCYAYRTKLARGECIIVCGGKWAIARNSIQRANYKCYGIFASNKIHSCFGGEYDIGLIPTHDSIDKPARYMRFSPMCTMS